MKAHRFISSAVALQTFGFDYVGHFKCGSCRYVVREAGGLNSYLVCKEYAANGRQYSIQVEDPFQADGRLHAIARAERVVLAQRGGYNSLVTIADKASLN